MGIVIAVLIIFGLLGVGTFLYLKRRRTGRRKPRKDLGLSMELDQAPISGRTEGKYPAEYVEPVGREDKYELEDNATIREPEPVRNAIRYPDPDDEIPSGNTHYWRG